MYAGIYKKLNERTRKKVVFHLIGADSRSTKHDSRNSRNSMKNKILGCGSLVELFVRIAHNSQSALSLSVVCFYSLHAYNHDKEVATVSDSEQSIKINESYNLLGRIVK